MSSDAQDKKWMLAVRRGDYEAFDQVYHAYYRRMYNFFYRLSRDADEAEDLLQETFIRLWKNAMQFDPDRRLSPYMYRIAKNAFLDRERRRSRKEQEILATESVLEGRRGRDSVAPMDSAVAAMDSTVVMSRSGHAASAPHAASGLGVRPETIAQHRELSAEIEEALQKLDVDKRMVIVLAFYQGMTLREIAEILDVPLGTVKSRAFYGERQLRETLKHLKHDG